MLEISKNDCFRALSIWKNEDLELYLKSRPNSCFVSNYFDSCLRAWLANMDRQLVFNEYKAVTYMCQYFSITKNQCSHAIKQATKEVFGNNLHHHDTTKTIVKAYWIRIIIKSVLTAKNFSSELLYFSEVMFLLKQLLAFEK